MEVIAGLPEVLATITGLLEGFQVASDQVAMGTAFETLGLDSLDLVELSVKIEDAYGIDIEEDDLSDVVTVGDAANIVVRKLGS